MLCVRSTAISKLVKADLRLLFTGIVLPAAMRHERVTEVELLVANCTVWNRVLGEHRCQV